jgi:hypothetical protein
MMTNEHEMRWGSCQYDAAVEMYDGLMELQEEFGRDIVMKANGCENVKPGEFAECRKHFVNEVNADLEPDEFIVESDFVNVENMFDYCRDFSWDLWSAAPFIACIMFPELNLNNFPKTPPDKTFGPILNKLVQSENDVTGFCCWLLKSFELADESDFIGFDT